MWTDDKQPRASRYFHRSRMRNIQVYPQGRSRIPQNRVDFVSSHTTRWLYDEEEALRLRQWIGERHSSIFMSLLHKVVRPSPMLQAR